MKKVLSLAIIFVLLLSIVPMNSSFAAEEGMYGPAGAVTSLGITPTEVQELVSILDDFYGVRGGATFEIAAKDFFEDYFDYSGTSSATLYDIFTMINDISGSDIVTLATTLKGLDTSDTNSIVSDLNGIKTNFQPLIDNLNTEYYNGVTFDAGKTRIATYSYYLGRKLQNDKIATFDDNGDDFAFDFANRLSNSDSINSYNSDTFTLDEYSQMLVDFGYYGGSFDDYDSDLEDYLNDELDAYLASGSNEYTAKEIANALNAVGLVEMSDSTPSSGGGGTSSGGSTGGTTTTTTPPVTATDDEDFVNDSEAAQETISDPTATAEEIIDAVDQLTQTASDLIDGDDVDGEEAAAIVNKVIEETIAKAIASNQTTKSQKHQLTKTARRLAERAAIKAGTVNLTGETEITKALVEEAIEKAKAAIESLEETLSTLGLANANRPMKATLTLKFDDEDSEVTLSSDVIASLKGLNSNLAIGSRGSSILIPSETLATVGEGETIEISSKMVSAGLNAGLNNQAGVKYKFFKTKDIVVSKKKADGTSEQLTRLSLTFDLSDYDGNANQVAVLVRNNETEEFKLLKSWVVAGQLQFKSPHYSYYTLAEYTPGFNDIDNHWAQGVINKMAAKAIVEGRSEEIFDPQGEITRAEFITMLMNAFDYEGTITTSFEDTNVNDWFYTPVNAGKALGLVNGVGQNQFNPNTSITRQDMVVMMARFFEEETAERLVSSEDMFGDSSNASGYARYYINGAAEVNIVSGDGEGFKPLNNATRAEALKMIDNLFIYLK